jgi:hypothetical protein
MAELPTQRDFEDFSAWTGRDVVAPDGERLGAVELIFLDEATDLPEWVLVRLDDEDVTAFVPLAGASVEERSIRVDQDREKVAAAPRLDAGETLTVAECRRLYEHDGLAYSEEESPTVLPEGAGAGTVEPPTEEREARPRLRKYVGAPVPATDATSDEPAEPVPSATAPPTPIPGPAPQAIPPEGGFQAREAGDEGGRSNPLTVLTGRPAIPIALASAIAALIAVLVVRNRR